MAARHIQRRLLSFILSKPASPQPRVLSRREIVSQSSPAASSIFRRDGHGRRGIQTIAEGSNLSVEDSSKVQSDSSSSSAASSPVAKVTSNLKMSSTHDLAMLFTCKVCDTRSVKTLSRVSYEKGVVLARCGGCNNVHLISDRLGWFGEPGSIEEFLAERGEEVKKGDADTISLTLEDLVGTKKLDA
ncbi:OLC1v1026058C1 [Oldenlandia corymbosa var. corymbosa]|uniref:OLC1v1026058C1 n=1 Tax=Oldenlandia corymbosa var. corymbosa TaxID=529605 RepID=A0AAV1C6A2_OLDCO|nr:OLC1v1026058C1 [Oldenlandia corymbosa var. corymbosa]